MNHFKLTHIIETAMDYMRENNLSDYEHDNGEFVCKIGKPVRKKYL